MGERYVMTDEDIDRDIAESEAEYEQRRQSMVKAKSADGRLSCLRCKWKGMPGAFPILSLG